MTAAKALCPECGGDGVVTCYDCDGSGDCQHCFAGPCPDCEGDGNYDCPICKGTGEDA